MIAKYARKTLRVTVERRIMCDGSFPVVPAREFWGLPPRILPK